MTSSLAYHRATSYERLKMKGHSLDWANRPSLHKIYPGLPVIHLPEFQPIEKSDLWNLNSYDNPDISLFDFHKLSSILDLTYLNTAKARHPDGDFFYRSAASAGALYPGEIYLAADDLDGLTAGIYHYNIMHRHLTQICEGNFQHSETEISAEIPPTEHSVSFFITGIFFRSAWKYKERAYRYVLLDAGHILQNLVFALKANSLPFILQYDFRDLAVNRTLGLDDQREVCLACVHLLTSPRIKRSDRSEEFSLPHESLSMTSKTSMRETAYPEIQDIHTAGTLVSISEPSPIDCIQQIGAEPAKWQKLENTGAVENEIVYPDAVFLRRSKRNFINEQLSHNRFLRLLDLFRTGLPNISADKDACLSSVATGFIANNIENLIPGFYLYDPERHCIGLVKEGSFTDLMAQICLEQNWLKNASVHFLFMSNLKTLDDIWGARGYRYAMITAGRMGQLVYVGATALNLGCCGIGAIFDYEAQKLLGLNTDSFLTYLVAAGLTKS